MGANVNTWPTLLDLARRSDPNGTLADVAEILNQYNEVLDDMAWVEGNMTTGHKTTVRASIPLGTWRLINQGIVPQKSQSNQITDNCGMLENYSEIDKKLAELNGNTAAWRLSEEKPIIEGMGQSLCNALIYGDTSLNPERFVGLAPRYWTLDTTKSVTAANVIDAGGTTNLTSIWLVGWSTDTIHGIFPKGSKAGLGMKDLGEQTIYPASGGQFQGYRTHYTQDAGLTIRDWRFVVRIANVDLVALATAGDANDSSANVLKLMSLALDKFPPIGNVRPVFYMNQTVRSMIRVKLLAKSNTFLTLENWQSPIAGLNRPTLTYMGVPCRRVDAITSNETQVV